MFDFIKQMATDVATVSLEGLIERSARSDYVLMLIEDQKRVANGIDDGMRERVFVVKNDEFRFVRHSRN